VTSAVKAAPASIRTSPLASKPVVWRTAAPMALGSPMQALGSPVTLGSRGSGGDVRPRDFRCDAEACLASHARCPFLEQCQVR